jgi:hypothetical protein
VTASTVPGRTVRGIRDSIPSGYYLGRTSAGLGPVELVNGGFLAQGVDAAIAGAGGGLIVMGIKTSGSGIANVSGTLQVEWNAGTVNAIGPGLSIVAGTSTSPGTLEANWQAGTVTAIGTGLSIASGTLEATALPEEWNAGTVNALGTTAGGGTLSITSNTLFAAFPASLWSAGSVAALGTGLILSGTTLQDTGPFATWSPTDFASGGTFQAVALTNINLTIQQTGNSGNGVSVDRATIPQTTGKFYVEETFVSGASTILRLGIMESSATIAIPSSGATGALLWETNGNVINNGTSVAAIAAYGAGSVVSQAIDLVNGEWWGRVNGGNWNNAGTASPATNVGGIALSPLTGAMQLTFYNIPFSAAQAKVTLNSGQSSFAQAVPAGFVPGWPYAGLVGPSGAIGATGSIGPQGSIGLTGSIGPQGSIGLTGSTGPAGATIWNAGSVTVLGTSSAGTLSLSGTTLNATYNNPYTAAALSAFHSGLTLTSGTLIPDWQNGTVTALNTGLTLTSGTISPNWQGGSVTTIGTGLSLTSGTLTSNVVGGLTHPQVMARVNVGFR